MTLGLSASVYGQYDIEDQQTLGTAGVWLGPVMPVPGSPLSSVLETDVAGGGFFRFNFPSNEWMLEIQASYQKYSAYDISSVELIPFGAGITYKLPIDFSIDFFVRATLGAVYATTTPSGKSNILPMGNFGVEFSFPTGPMLNVGMRIEYLFVYESYLSPPAGAVNYTVTDGHFFNFGLMVNFEIPAK